LFELLCLIRARTLHRPGWCPRRSTNYSKYSRGAIDLLTEPKNPGGCLWVQGALACGEAADPVRQELAARRAAGEAALRQRFKRARSEGDLAPDADPAGLARYVTTITLGMAVQAAGGAGRKELRKVADTAMRAWPA
jgi:hypothetical protein